MWTPIRWFGAALVLSSAALLVSPEFSVAAPPHGGAHSAGHASASHVGHVGGVGHVSAGHIGGAGHVSAGHVGRVSGVGHVGGVGRVGGEGRAGGIARVGGSGANRGVGQYGHGGYGRGYGGGYYGGGWPGYYGGYDGGWPWYGSLGNYGYPNDDSAYYNNPSYPFYGPSYDNSYYDSMPPYQPDYSTAVPDLGARSPSIITANPALTGTPQPDQQATVTVVVPGDAEVWVNGVPLGGQGTVRQFVTPPLTAGGSYTYEVRAVWQQYGQQVSRMKTVVVSPGSNVELTFQ